LRSAGNTNDLRGKILRIHPEPDGSYTIPAGNLFAKDTPGTRPEIYIMGCRNPYRITVDRPTGILYWGEVGPDADRDSTRGPRGYDEFNQARQAGNFGWPLFIGNSQAYTHVDFRNNEQLLGRFDPLRPINFSANNTGLRELPPAQNAFIWYPYDASPDFPAVGVGGRRPLVGRCIDTMPLLRRPSSSRLILTGVGSSPTGCGIG
jgi:cytochrome c